MQTAEFVTTEPFMPGDAVRSFLYGFGRVVVGGRVPAVRFVSGIERRIDGDDLDIVGEAEFCDTVANIGVIEILMHFRTEGARTATWFARGVVREFGELLHGDTISRKSA